LKSERIAPASLRHLIVLGTWPFLSARFVECDALSFAEFVEAYAFKAGRMKEQVFIAANVNESKTFVSKSFNRAFSHSRILTMLSSIRLNRIIQPELLRDHHNSKIKKVGYNGDLQHIFATRTVLNLPF
jgi:hypothetical protein